LLGAFTSLAFRQMTGWLHTLMTGHQGNYVESMGSLPFWQRIALLTGGGLIGGLLLFAGRRWLRRSTSGDYMEAVLLGDGVVSARASLVKSASALFSISSGASIGREGPLVQLSTMMASLTARWRAFSPVKSRLLVACGAAAGIASAYNAPISGALFVAEILLGTLAMETFGPLVFSSVISTVATRLWLGSGALYLVPPIRLGSYWEMLPLLLPGLASGLLAPLFLKSLDVAGRPFAGMPSWLRPALGGLVVGVMACFLPEICGNGHTIVNQLLSHQMVWSFLVFVFVFKWIATCITFGSGTVGGVFTPTLFLGAALGSLSAQLCAIWWPGHLTEEIFVLVGMGAFLAATTHASIMAILMIFEMSLDYEIILPLMLACVIAQSISQGLHPHSIYFKTLRRKGAGLVMHRLSRMRVGDLLKRETPTVDPAATFATVAENFINQKIGWLHVTRENGTWLGAISLHDVKAFLQQPELTSLVIARDVLHPGIPVLSMETSLEQALEAFSSMETDSLPVLDKSQEARLLGTLHRSDLMLALAERPDTGTTGAVPH
jgi:CIC family chloride channel protein